MIYITSIEISNNRPAIQVCLSVSDNKILIENEP